MVKVETLPALMTLTMCLLTLYLGDRAVSSLSLWEVYQLESHLTRVSSLPSATATT